MKFASELIDAIDFPSIEQALKDGIFSTLNVHFDGEHITIGDVLAQPARCIDGSNIDGAIIGNGVLRIVW